MINVNEIVNINNMHSQISNIRYRIEDAVETESMIIYDNINSRVWRVMSLPNSTVNLALRNYDSFKTKD